jgi:hypothetical protein
LVLATRVFFPSAASLDAGVAFGLAEELTAEAVLGVGVVGGGGVPQAPRLVASRQAASELMYQTAWVVSFVCIAGLCKVPPG